MENLYYILENKEPKIVNNIRVWGKWFDNFENRIIKQTTIRGVLISTVFLGLDHRYGPGEPLLFETMIFQCCEFDGYQERYSTYDEAEEGHQKACEMVNQFLK